MEKKLQPIQILMVEDNDMGYVPGIAMLKMLNCETTLATLGCEALKKIQPTHQAVIIDLTLPDMNGFELAKKIRAGNKEIADIPLIGFAGYVFGEQEEKMARQSNMSGLLLKPYTIGQFNLMIDTFIKNKPEKGFFLLEPNIPKFDLS